jgi:ABC-type lipoprotein export system ATPase subunit
MLARAIACKPDLLLVDEPTAQLDPVTAHAVNGSLLSLADRGTIVVVATHDSDTRDSCGFQVDLGDFR